MLKAEQTNRDKAARRIRIDAKKIETNDQRQVRVFHEFKADEQRRKLEAVADARRKPFYTQSEVQNAHQIVFGNLSSLGHAKERDIKAAYREASKAKHPDKNNGKNEAFVALKPAFDLLMHATQFGIKR